VCEHHYDVQQIGGALTVDDLSLDSGRSEVGFGCSTEGQGIA
jgi:hypothetical protein